MICYRDRTFCPFWRECANGADCDRALTDEVRAGAMAAWGGRGLPIAQWLVEPECFEGKDDD